MAKKDKKKKADKSEKKKKKKGLPWSTQIMLIFGVVMAIAFMQSTVIIAVGMLPTLVAAIADRTGKGTLAITVGAMNLAGCCPFLLELWLSGHEVDMGFKMISNPTTIIVMYSAAAMGYVINWSLSGIVEVMMAKKYAIRAEQIEKRKAILKKQWGEEVTGDIALDSFGFPLEQPEQEEAAAPVVKA